MGWSPTADRSTNPFTGYTAARQGADNVAANELEIELGGTVTLIRPQDTKRWFGLKVGAFDQIGAARQPDDERTYSHKLDLEINTSYGIFSWLPKGNYLRNVAASLTWSTSPPASPAATTRCREGNRCTSSTRTVRRSSPG